MALHPSIVNDPTGALVPYIHVPGFAGTSAQRVAYGTSFYNNLSPSMQWFETDTKNTYQWTSTSSRTWQLFGVLSGTSAITTGITNLTGDLTANGPGSVTGTLATVNSNVGTFGSATTVPVFTVNGKGLVTAVGTSTISVTATYKVPTVQRFLAGTSTYTTPSPAPLYLKVRLAGGGAGAGASGTGGGSGTSGLSTTFGTNLLFANGGFAGIDNDAGGAGGNFSVNSPAINVASVNGGYGGPSVSDGGPSGNTYGFGGNGGSNPFGGAGGARGGTGGSANGFNGATNTGAGGGGASANSVGNAFAGSGGGAGGYVEAIIPNPTGTYSVTIGTGGTGGTAGTGGANGGNGAAGVAVIEEIYQ